MSFFFTNCTPSSTEKFNNLQDYLLDVIRPAVDLSVAKVARRLPFEQRQTDGTAQAGSVPGTAIDIEKVLIGDRFPAGGAYSQLCLQ